MNVWFRQRARWPWRRTQWQLCRRHGRVQKRSGGRAGQRGACTCGSTRVRSDGCGGRSSTKPDRSKHAAATATTAITTAAAAAYDAGIRIALGAVDLGVSDLPFQTILGECGARAILRNVLPMRYMYGSRQDGAAARKVAVLRDAAPAAEREAAELREAAASAQLAVQRLEHENAALRQGREKALERSAMCPRWPSLVICLGDFTNGPLFVQQGDSELHWVARDATQAPGVVDGVVV